MIDLLFFSLITFSASFILLIITLSYSRKKNLLAIPSDNRWHTTPTPLFGGVGFVPVAILGYAFLGYIFPEVSSLLIAVSIALFLFFILGLIDDIFAIGALLKLISQIVIVSLIIFLIDIPLIFDNQFLHYAFLYLWFLTIINSINMIDNMDGLSSGVGLVIILNLFSVKFLYFDLEEYWPFFALALIFFPLLAFWFKNKNPAKIFMGDCGSLPFGILLAIIPFIIFNDIDSNTLQKPISDTYLFLTIIGLIYFIPLADFSFVVITRILKGKKPYIGGKDHLSHSLVGIGFGEKFSVNILITTGLFFGLLAHISMLYKVKIVFLFFGIILSFICIYLILKKGQQN